MTDPIRPDRLSRLASWSIAAAILLTTGLTFLSWLTVDLDDTWALVPDRVPDALLLAVDRGLSPHELIGVGLVLAALCLAAGACFAVAVARGSWHWLLGSSALLAAAGGIGIVVTVVLLATQALVELFLPSGWDEFDPDLGVGAPAYLFVVLCFVVSSITLTLWTRLRPRRT
ncbi:MAG: hypothetical protein AAF548_03045 [Actinomycetota bacterium]